jgi:hypothetical protein
MSKADGPSNCTCVEPDEGASITVSVDGGRTSSPAFANDVRDQWRASTFRDCALTRHIARTQNRQT